ERERLERRARDVCVLGRLAPACPAARAGLGAGRPRRGLAALGLDGVPPRPPGPGRPPGRRGAARRRPTARGPRLHGPCRPPAPRGGLGGPWALVPWPARLPLPPPPGRDPGSAVRDLHRGGRTASPAAHPMVLAPPASSVRTLGSVSASGGPVRIRARAAAGS